jgi:hypothetical protein
MLLVLRPRIVFIVTERFVDVCFQGGAKLGYHLLGPVDRRVEAGPCRLYGCEKGLKISSLGVERLTLCFAKLLGAKTSSSGHRTLYRVRPDFDLYLVQA